MSSAVDPAHEDIFGYPHWTAGLFEHSSLVIPAAGVASIISNITPGMLKYRVPMVVVNHLAAKEYLRTKLSKIDGEIIALSATVPNAIVAWSSHIEETGHCMPTLAQAGQCKQCGVVVLFLTLAQLRSILIHEGMHVSDSNVMMATLHRPVRVHDFGLTVHNAITCIAKPMRVVVGQGCTVKDLTIKVNKVAALTSALNDFDTWNGYTLSTFRMLQYIHKCAPEKVRTAATVALTSKSYRMALSGRLESEPISFLSQTDITPHTNLGSTMLGAESLLNSYAFD